MHDSDPTLCMMCIQCNRSNDFVRLEQGFFFSFPSKKSPVERSSELAGLLFGGCPQMSFIEGCDYAMRFYLAMSKIDHCSDIGFESLLVCGVLVCELQECLWMNLSASIMMVLEGCSATKDHLFLINTLMQLKKDVCLVSLGV